MNRRIQNLINDKRHLEENIENYISEKVITKVKPNEDEIKGHIEKARHNQKFTKDVLALGYTDWALVGCYYTIYHSALALCIKKGYKSKNHNATLHLLIRNYHTGDLTEEDISLIEETYLTSQDIMFYLESKQVREKASYTTETIFDKSLISDIKIKTTLFLNKAISIIENS